MINRKTLSSKCVNVLTDSVNSWCAEGKFLA